MRAVSIKKFEGPPGNRDVGQILPLSDAKLVVNHNGAGPGWLLFDCMRCLDETVCGNAIKLDEWLNNNVAIKTQRLLSTPSAKYVLAAMLLCNRGHYVCAINTDADTEPFHEHGPHEKETMKIVNDVAKQKGPDGMITATQRIVDIQDMNYSVVAALFVNKNYYQHYTVPIYNVYENSNSDCMAAACAVFFHAIPGLYWTMLKTLYGEDSTFSQLIDSRPFIRNLLNSREISPQGATTATIGRSAKCNLMSHFKSMYDGHGNPPADVCLQSFKSDFEYLVHVIPDLKALTPPATFTFGGNTTVKVARTQFLSIVLMPPAVSSHQQQMTDNM
jgi:hypothetical protein